MAKEIATQSGTDYAIMSGGSFRELSAKEQISQLKKIFEWAKTLEKRGKKLIVFVDEADYFLLDQRLIDLTDKEMGETRKATQTIFLKNFEEAGAKSIMFIFATNFYKNFHPAVSNRIGKKVRFSLPKEEQRREMLRVYIDSEVKKVGISLEPEVEEKIINEFAKDENTKGFSGRVVKDLVRDLAAAGIREKSLDWESAKRAMNFKIDKELFDQGAEIEKQIRYGFEAIGAEGFVPKKQLQKQLEEIKARRVKVLKEMGVEVD